MEKTMELKILLDVSSKDKDGFPITLASFLAELSRALDVRQLRDVESDQDYFLVGHKKS